MTMITLPPTANFVVSYDDSLTNGPALANAVVASCEASLASISALFGGIMPPAASLPFHVDLIPGGGGASHPGCASTHITCYCSPTSDTIGVPALTNAEVAEVFMAVQGQGLDCGGSAGEALSRVFPGILDPSVRFRFSVGSSWLNTNPRPNWVDTTEPTDQNLVSIGCGTLFLNYLADELGFAWADIIAAAAPTLGQLAANLGLQNAFLDFNALLAHHYPPGTPVFLPDDDPFPLPDVLLYIRHNLADDGTTHNGPLSSSPDIIVRNSAVADPQTTFSTPASVASMNESDPFVIDGQPNYVYLRVWNRGLDATNVTANAYWSPPATLVTPSLWNPIGSADFINVPAGRVVQVSDPGITWNTVPAPGHYCFVATVGNVADPPPTPASFPSFDDYVRYIGAHNDIAWRNFDVVASGAPHEPMGDYAVFPFHFVGAWDVIARFGFEFAWKLPAGTPVALDVPDWLGRALEKLGKVEQLEEGLVRIHLELLGKVDVGEIEFPAGTVAPSRLLVALPKELEGEHEVAVIQRYGDREVGRITWRFVSRAEHERREHERRERESC
jgi:hypothetical protein